MFTGLIETVGIVTAISALGEGREVAIKTSLSPSLTLGESVAIDGICSTVVKFTDSDFTVQFLKETLDKTTVPHWSLGRVVNLEQAMLPTTRLGGHVVTGHVELTVRIAAIENRGPWHVFEFVFSETVAPYLIDKGSVTLDGISLTVVDLRSDRFSCHIIPHTFLSTGLQFKRVREEVNMEPDVMAKYFYRFYQLEKEKSHV